jgi:MoaA/NifB/PqqE/SkfB family radical SAM enzyme
MTATALVRADLCEDARLLELMKEAGVTNLSVGIESLSDQTRSDFKKKISQNIIKKSIDIFHEHGFTIIALFIVGYDTDDLDTFQRIRHFISETGIEKWRISPLSQTLESTDEFMAAHRCFLWDEFHVLQGNSRLVGQLKHFSGGGKSVGSGFANFPAPSCRQKDDFSL